MSRIALYIDISGSVDYFAGHWHIHVSLFIIVRWFLIIQWSFMPIKARYRIDTYITIEYSITKHVSERSYQFVLWNIGQHFSVTLYHFQYIYFKNWNSDDGLPGNVGH